MNRMVFKIMVLCGIHRMLQKHHTQTPIHSLVILYIFHLNEMNSFIKYMHLCFLLFPEYRNPYADKLSQAMNNLDNNGNKDELPTILKDLSLSDFSGIDDLTYGHWSINFIRFVFFYNQVVMDFIKCYSSFLSAFFRH